MKWSTFLYTLYIDALNHNSNLFTISRLPGFTTAYTLLQISKRESTKSPYTTAVKNASFLPSLSVWREGVVMHTTGVIARLYDVLRVAYSGRDRIVVDRRQLTRALARQL